MSMVGGMTAVMALASFEASGEVAALGQPFRAIRRPVNAHRADGGKKLR